MKRKDGKPRVWVTHITGHLAGENQCAWQPWIKARFWYRKRKDDGFDSEAWRTRHTATVEAVAATLIRQGAIVTVENENAFEFVGNTAVLAGKCDIVATLPDEGGTLVIDVKTGRVRSSDFWQVLVYLLALPKLNKAIDPKRIEGEVAYSDFVQRVGNDELTEERAARIYTMLRMIGSDAAPARTPSKMECRFCDIDECSDRFIEPAAVPASTEF